MAPASVFYLNYKCIMVFSLRQVLYICESPKPKQDGYVDGVGSPKPILCPHPLLLTQILH